MAFNKAIASELVTRVPKNIKVSTLHALGWGALRRTYEGQLEADKVYFCIQELCKEWTDMPDQRVAFFNRIQKIVDLMRLTLGANLDDANVLCEKYDIENFDFEAEKAIEVFDIVSIDRTCFDFVDMLYVPVTEEIQFPKYDCVLVDEVQDCSKLQHKLIDMIIAPNGRAIYIGDPCQPTGTLVSVVKKPGNKWHKPQIDLIPIEQLKVGEKVISYNLKDCSFVRSGREVKGISKNEYEGNLIKVTLTNGQSTKYTPNHHCVANFSPLRNHYCVYLMSRGNQFRIGSAKMDYGSNLGGGPAARMNAEGAENLWILAIYTTKEEARKMEQAIGGKYNIPQTVFKSPNQCPVEQQKIDFIWKYIGTNNSNGASYCLKDFGRLMSFPLFKITQIHKSLKRPMVIHACNLMNGVSMLPFNENDRVSNKKAWIPISIENEYYKGFVYSMTVDKESLYIGDGIVTHNCQSIYSFLGADPESFASVLQKPNTVKLPLTVSYRCAKNIIRHAQQIVPEIQYHDDKPEGEVILVGSVKNIKEGDMVLCRINSPLVCLCLEFINEGRKAYIRGSDIGKSLVAFVKSYENKSLDFMYSKLEQRYRKLCDRMSKIYPNRALESIKQVQTFLERKRAINAIADTVDTVAQVIEKINFLFSDDNKAGIVLSTIHKAKGLESQNVFIIEPKLIPFPYYLNNEWQVIEERNLDYVARTRAINKLEYVRDWTSMEKKK